ncbi:mitochondrial enolase superfamily member 1-like [Sitodiplosis mosellana]|uniref:mitochondrial enolase superfamily member 1-like n=1 Tax=Sitodiplosis mosellana TaxID=263140 RepID=UPI0024450B41|nr:mitochondrial enolase superfamily member 1-like [Sitodiplosis mosellana]XP_055305829.1 mitochondrial enolase superfamily member 1-like [Sitodiplosis mosellana]XP_055305830.1 mitochondrial enolase superfamily member 1-like [Sitodiplosis mosellana]XP_055305831.1 mitochondrial enolase superfamily member 1-like [Sitodiplosis mosellana]
MSLSNIKETLKIVSVDAKDIRWPTSLGGHGSDAMHTDPDYSCVYVTIKTNESIEGYGLTFTLGRGNEIVRMGCKALSTLIVDRHLRNDIYARFGIFWRELTSETQMRWLGPEKGVMHLAVSAIINALWDLWAKLEKKPLWRLLCDMDPVLLVSTIDFRYISDVVTPAEAVKMLKEGQNGKQQRIDELLKNGYPCYTTQVGWIGYSDEYRRSLCKEYLAQGFNAFKLKVGQNLEDDRHRCRLVREEIGWKNKLMVDANQIWDVNEAIEWMKNLSEFKIWWIEEPTSPDDALGHATIAKALKPYGIGVASGEACMNRIMFKQFLQAGALEFCQIDSARIGGVNEILSVYFMAKKFGVKVCPHAGGVGLCEMVQHLQMWDFTSVSCTNTDRYVEYVDQQHEQFVNPTNVKNAHYLAPTAPGYSTELKKDAIVKFEYPNGSEWQNMFKLGIMKEIKY